MGGNSSKNNSSANSAVDDLKTIPGRLTSPNVAGSVTVGYDPANSTQDKPNDGKPIIGNAGIRNALTNKYPDGSVTMGDPAKKTEA